MRILRKYLKITQMGIKQAMAYKYAIILSLLATSISVFILHKFWGALYGDGDQYRYMANYATLAQILGLIYSMRASGKLMRGIRSGSISIELLRPWNYLISLLFEDLGNVGGALLTKGFLLYVLSLCFWGLKIPDLLSLLMFFEAIFFAYILLFLIKITIAMISFWVIEASSLLILLDIVINLLSGQFLPAWIMPDWLEKIINGLPFIWIYQKPIEIYLSSLGGMESLNYLQIIFSQLLWIMVLVTILCIMWKKAIDKLSIQGG